MKFLKKVFDWFLMTIMIILLLGFFGLIEVAESNFTFNENAVLRDIKLKDPKVTEMLVLERNIIDLSKMLVGNEDGSQSIYYIDTNILYNHDYKITGPIDCVYVKTICGTEHTRINTECSKENMGESDKYFPLFFSIGMILFVIVCAELADGPRNPDLWRK